MCPLPSHKSSGPMGSKSKSVLMTVAPWDPEALAAFDSPDIVTGPRGRLATLGLKRTGILCVLCPI